MKRVMLMALLALMIMTQGIIGETVELTFVCPAWQGDTVKEVKAIVAEWNAANPDIQVEILWQSWETLNKYLLTSFQGGQAPDIFHQDAVMCYEYGMLGYAAPLNDYLSDETISDIPASAWRGVSDDEGTIYGVPFLQETLVIFYNRTLFADAGITLPADGMVTWDELRGYARLLTKRNEAGEVTTWGLLAPLEQRLWWCLVKQNEGHVLQRHDDGTWHVEIDENAREAIRSFTDMVTVDQTMPTDILSYDFMSLLRGFKNGQYAMFSYGSWVRSWLVRLARGELDWGMLQIRGEKKMVTEADPQALGVYVNSPHKEEAIRFLEFFTNTENSARIAYADWLFPIRQSALERPEFQSEENQWNVAYQWLPYAQDVKPRMFAFFAWEWQSFLPQIELVILGEQDLDTALEVATRRGNLFLRRMGLQ